MRLAIVSDAWWPQVNGVVRTLSTVAEELRRLGHELLLLTPEQFWTVPCPTYPEIRLAVLPGGKLAGTIAAFRPQAIHIATEGPLGHAARRYCLRRGLPFTTSFHTRFPEYIHARIRLPTAWSYAWLRWFHQPAAATMVATDSMARELSARGFGHLRRWGRGVDVSLFRPQPKRSADPRPIALFVGRVAVEKNLDAFLQFDWPGSKHVVGDGPQLPALKRRYPTARFLGARFGEALAACYAEADVFCFPSLTDTFGLVLLEALAAGVPVAAYPVTGPLDVLGDAAVGCLEQDLGQAARKALSIPAEACRAFALRHSWAASAQQFVGNLAVF